MNRRGFLRAAVAAAAALSVPAVAPAELPRWTTASKTGLKAGQAINVMIYGGSRGGGKTRMFAHVLSKHPGPVYVTCTSDAQREHWKGMLFDIDKQECRELPVRVVRRVDLDA